jgi:NAD(P)H dehydrogenase (quinone)
MSIVVTGATGAVGSKVVANLLAGGVTPAVVVRDASRLADPSAVDVRIAPGYADPIAMTAALAGCDTMFLVSGRESADRVSEHLSAVAAAVEAGVEQVVYLSFQGASPNCTFTFGRDHWHTEQAIRTSGLGFTFLRDSFYQAALAQMCGPDGVLRGPAGDGAVAAVAHDDVAAVATAALLTDRWVGETLDLTGPEALTLSDAAETMSEMRGVPVRYVPETVEEAYASRSHYGAPDFEVAGWVSSYLAIANGEVSQVSDAVERVTGHPPINFRSYLSANPHLLEHIGR